MRKVFIFTGKEKDIQINKTTLKWHFFSRIKLASAFKTNLIAQQSRIDLC